MRSKNGRSIRFTTFLMSNWTVAVSVKHREQSIRMKFHSRIEEPVPGVGIDVARQGVETPAPGAVDDSSARHRDREHPVSRCH